MSDLPTGTIPSSSGIPREKEHGPILTTLALGTYDTPTCGYNLSGATVQVLTGTGNIGNAKNGSKHLMIGLDQCSVLPKYRRVNNSRIENFLDEVTVSVCCFNLPDKLASKLRQDTSTRYFDVKDPDTVAKLRSALGVHPGKYPITIRQDRPGGTEQNATITSSLSIGGSVGYFGDIPTVGGNFSFGTSDTQTWPDFTIKNWSASNNMAHNYALTEAGGKKYDRTKSVHDRVNDALVPGDLDGDYNTVHGSHMRDPPPRSTGSLDILSNVMFQMDGSFDGMVAVLITVEATTVTAESTGYGIFGVTCEASATSSKCEIWCLVDMSTVTPVNFGASTASMMLFASPLKLALDPTMSASEVAKIRPAGARSNWKPEPTTSKTLELGFNIRGTHTRHTGGHGPMVTQIIPGTIAAKSGLREGDIIKSIDGTKVTTPSEFCKELESSEAPFALDVHRDGKVLEDIPLMSFATGFGTSYPFPLKKNEVFGSFKVKAKNANGVEFSYVVTLAWSQNGLKAYQADWVSEFKKGTGGKPKLFSGSKPLVPLEIPGMGGKNQEFEIPFQLLEVDVVSEKKKLVTLRYDMTPGSGSSKKSEATVKVMNDLEATTSRLNEEAEESNNPFAGFKNIDQVENYRLAECDREVNWRPEITEKYAARLVKENPSTDRILDVCKRPYTVKEQQALRSVGLAYKRLEPMSGTYNRLQLVEGAQFLQDSPGCTLIHATGQQRLERNIAVETFVAAYKVNEAKSDGSAATAAIENAERVDVPEPQIRELKEMVP